MGFALLTRLVSNSEICLPLLLSAWIKVLTIACLKSICFYAELLAGELSHVSSETWEMVTSILHPVLKTLTTISFAFKSVI